MNREIEVGKGKITTKRPGGPDVGQEVTVVAVYYGLGNYGCHVCRTNTEGYHSMRAIGVHITDFICFYENDSND